MPAFSLAAQPGWEGEHSLAGPTAAAGRQLQHPATSCAPAPVCSADGPHACPGWPIFGLFWRWALCHSPKLHIAPDLSLSAGSEERASVRRPVQGQREWRSQVALRASHMVHNRRSVRPAATLSLTPRSVFKCHNSIMSCKCSSVAEALTWNVQEAQVHQHAQCTECGQSPPRRHRDQQGCGHRCAASAAVHTQKPLRAHIHGVISDLHLFRDHTCLMGDTSLSCQDG